MRGEEFLKIKGSTPRNFQGSVQLPPSKSYFHRALFVSSLCESESKIVVGDSQFSDDVSATIRILSALGVKFSSSRDMLRLRPRPFSGGAELFARGSGTTARFAISIAALAKKGETTIAGDLSLSKRPMQPLLDSLSELGVECYSKNHDGKLPIVVKGGGIAGGECSIDNSVSSQFLSSLLIACTRAAKDCSIIASNRSKVVSLPYIEATMAVLREFGFSVDRNASGTIFRIKGNQIVRGRNFKVPGDMSSAAALMACAIVSGGNLKLLGVQKKLPQADYAMVGVVRRFGAGISHARDSLFIKRMKRSGPLNFDMRHSPDLVPIVAGLAAGLSRGVKITNVAHLRFKESDRLGVISRELRKLGVRVKESKSSIEVFSSEAKKDAGRKPIVLDPESDHRVMMALTVAALSGRFGDVLVSEPSCVAKSYPNFVADVQRLVNEPGLIELVRQGGPF